MFPGRVIPGIIWRWRNLGQIRQDKPGGKIEDRDAALVYSRLTLSVKIRIDTPNIHD
jgi:hypothetical protein